jgi:hypothetical protein
MKKYLLLLSLLSPFLVCDPQAGVTYYTITGDSFFTGNIPAQADGSIKKDLAGSRLEPTPSRRWLARNYGGVPIHPLSHFRQPLRCPRLLYV